MASDAFNPLPGMADLCPPEIGRWQWLEAEARRVLALYGFEEVRTPILEKTAVFTRALGEGTDVVQKEMYGFADRGGRDLVLRPEGTAGVIRHVCGAGPEAREARLYYVGPMFRYERPQAGRRRQFHQLGVELLGPPSPVADAECIALQLHLLKAWDLEGGAVLLNTLGLPAERTAAAVRLREVLAPARERLCEDCRRRLDTNVLRVLDCKQEGCRGLVAALPPLAGLLSEESRAYFGAVLRLLERLGVAATVQPRLVRGFDYYAHTIWEITHPALGSQDAISGGGRYRVAMEGQEVEGVGFAIGLERIVAVLEAAHAAPRRLHDPLRVWIVSAGDRAREENLVLLQTLRQRGVGAGMDPGARSMKAQMRAANRTGAPWVVIRGDEELARGVLILRDMARAAQEEVALPALLERLAPR